MGRRLSRTASTLGIFVISRSLPFNPSYIWKPVSRICAEKKKLFSRWHLSKVMLWFMLLFFISYFFHLIITRTENICDGKWPGTLVFPSWWFKAYAHCWYFCLFLTNKISLWIIDKYLISMSLSLHFCSFVLPFLSFRMYKC